MASGPYSRIRAKMERTIFGIDIIGVDMQFGNLTAARLKDVVRGHKYTPSLADSVVRIVLETREALLTVDIMHGMELHRFLEESRANLRKAAAADLIPAAVFRQVNESLGPWFEFLDGRGFEEGDRLIYGIQGEAFRTIFITRGGQTLLDQTDLNGSERRLAVLAGYLAPDTDLRRDLIESLFER